MSFLRQQSLASGALPYFSPLYDSGVPLFVLYIYIGIIINLSWGTKKQPRIVDTPSPCWASMIPGIDLKVVHLVVVQESAKVVPPRKQSSTLVQEDLRPQAQHERYHNRE